ncbi:MAG: N-acetylneuraminate synthase family protein [Bacteroidia bacterium]|jgi:N-acetylneuraminate synthase|nr:N-acetylneuraminate synthase family protein [Bacteroidia bacterium]
MSEIFIIAEIAQAHEGSLGIAHSYIDALAETGVNAVKFQTHIAEAESSKEEQFRVNFSYEDKTRYDYWKRMEFSPEQWMGLKQHCEEKNMEFISSPFSLAAVDLLEKINVNKYKIGSGELTNYLMLDKIARTKKPIILSSGMSDWSELDDTINFLTPYGNPLSLLQCTTAYPTQPNQWGLSAIGEMRLRYGLPIGFSDHSADIIACLSAATLGATILEFHVVFHHQMFGPDAKASLTLEQTKQLVKSVRTIETALSSPHQKNDASNFTQLKNMFGKSLSVNKDLSKGHMITINDLESKKPGNQGIAAKEFQKVIGKELKRDLEKWSFLRDDDLI